MQARQLPLQVPPSSLFSPKVGSFVKPLDPVLTRVFFRERLREIIPETNERQMSAVGFAHEMLSNLDIRYHVPPADLSRLPATGPALVVANHPFGLLEGLLLLSILEKVRPDYRIVANGILSAFAPLRERARTENSRSLRSSLEWLAQSGLLVMFPAGEVSHLQWDERSVVDPKWNSAAARFARKIGCPTLPLFFDGANSHRFQMVGTLHPRLRTLNLLNELFNKSSREIEIRIGTPIAASTLRTFADAEAATAYLRARTYLLQNRPVHHGSHTFRLTPFSKSKQVAPPPPAASMAKEIDALPPGRMLAGNDEFSVILASAREIPSTLQEIGRSRELTYREVGEGTGRALDLDGFDEYYIHIILWHKQESRVAGAYRLAATSEILGSRGIEGLYSSTLFDYQPGFFEHIGPAIELGRSFICRDYQKHYSPLLLLWKGILKFVVDRP